MTVTLPLALLAGIVAFVSPCFLPIVPVFLTYLMGGTPQSAKAPTSAAPVAVGAGGTVGTGGTSAASTAVAAGAPVIPATQPHPETDPAGPARRGRRFAAAHAAAFIAGFTVVFVALWASIGLIGYLVGDHRDLLRIAGGAILIVLGLHVAGLVRIPVLYRSGGPQLRRDSGAEPSLPRSLIMGLAFGAGWTPCIGPILGGVLGLATTSDTVGQGTVLLVAFSLGLGIPFLLVALGATAVSAKLTWLLRHQTAVGLLNGAMLALIGFLMITNLFGKLAGLIPALGL